MIGQLGTWALAGGLVASVAAALLWLKVATAGHAHRRHARIATWAMLAAAAGACGTLEWALLSHDFSVSYVARNGGRDVPVYFTVTSLWAALDGSLLLWLLILGGYAVLLSRSVPPRARQLHPWALAVISIVGVFFFALTYFAANPFRTVSPVPADGPGPNPLLREHLAMGLHPPLLYAGYIGLVVPFGYALAALLAGRPGTAWLAATRRWALGTWALLTAGIAMGAWWSYAVLGWGGYWAWDPVENASLLPWLTATAFLHATMVRRGRASLTGWNVGLASASFLLVLLGTFLTRSGAVASVHAFTASPLGPMLLGFVLLAAVTVTVLVGWRGHRLGDTIPPARPLSRQTFLLGNLVLLTTVTAVVLTGTLFPLLSQAVAGQRTAVGAGYFNRAAVPLVIALLVLMGTATLLPRTGHGPAALRRQLVAPGACALATVATVGLFSRPGPAPLATFGCAAFVLVSAARLLRDRLRTARADGGITGLTRGGGTLAGLLRHRRVVGGLLAHIGLALVAVGVAGSAAYTRSTEHDLRPGEIISVDGLGAQLVAVDRHRGTDRMLVDARLVLLRGGKPVGALTPTMRYYPAHDMSVSVPAIRPGLLADTYATVTAVAPDAGTATIRLAVNPLVSLIWAGGALTALGGLLAIGRRGRRRRPAGAHRATPRREAAEPAMLVEVTPA